MKSQLLLLLTAAAAVAYARNSLGNRKSTNGFLEKFSVHYNGSVKVSTVFFEFENIEYRFCARYGSITPRLKQPTKHNQIDISCLLDLRSEFSISKEKVPEKFLKTFGLLSEYSLGEKEFDDSYLLFFENHEFADCFLYYPEIRNAINELFQSGVTYIRYHTGVFSVGVGANFVLSDTDFKSFDLVLAALNTIIRKALECSGDSHGF